MYASDPKALFTLHATADQYYDRWFAGETRVHKWDDGTECLKIARSIHNGRQANHAEYHAVVVVDILTKETVYVWDRVRGVVFDYAA